MSIGFASYKRADKWSGLKMSLPAFASNLPRNLINLNARHVNYSALSSRYFGKNTQISLGLTALPSKENGCLMCRLEKKLTKRISLVRADGVGGYTCLAS